MRGRIRLKVRGRARAELTSNILIMVLISERSKLSGWLNISAFCRVEREGIRNTCEVCGQEGGRGKAGGYGVCGGGASGMQERTRPEV